jgi:hypothetical protein
MKHVRNAKRHLRIFMIFIRSVTGASCLDKFLKKQQEKVLAAFNCGVTALSNKDEK